MINVLSFHFTLMIFLQNILCADDACRTILSSRDLSHIIGQESFQFTLTDKLENDPMTGSHVHSCSYVSKAHTSSEVSFRFAIFSLDKKNALEIYKEVREVARSSIRHVDASGIGSRANLFFDKEDRFQMMFVLTNDEKKLFVISDINGAITDQQRYSATTWRRDLAKHINDKLTHWQ